MKSLALSLMMCSCLLICSGMASCGSQQAQRAPNAQQQAPKPKDYSMDRLTNMNTMQVKLTLEDRLFKAADEKSLRTQFQRIVQGKGYLLCQGDSFCVAEGILSVVIKHDPRAPMTEWYNPTHLIVSMVVFDEGSREVLYEKTVGIRWAGSMDQTFSAILGRVDQEIPDKVSNTPTLIAPL